MEYHILNACLHFHGKSVKMYEKSQPFSVVSRLLGSVFVSYHSKDLYRITVKICVAVAKEPGLIGQVFLLVE